MTNSGAIVSDTASKLSIGDLELSNAAFLAPMAGITDAPFRARAARFGAGLVVSEMIASASLLAGEKDMERRLRRSEGLPHIVQLAGREANWLALGARMAAEAGANVIDINLGCPSKRVTNGFAGSALMRVPDTALRLIEAVVKATPLPVTVKMRLGWDDESINAPAIARAAVDAGVRMITVHGRTRQQFYKGKARWQAVRAVKDAVDVPVVVNGDIVDIASARRARQLSGADAVMIGRGAQGRPWIVGQIGNALSGKEPCSSPSGSDLVDLIVSHYLDMLAEYGTELGVRVARKHLGWYLDANFTEVDPKDRKALLVETDPDIAIARLVNLIADAPKAAA